MNREIFCKFHPEGRKEDADRILPFSQVRKMTRIIIIRIILDTGPTFPRFLFSNGIFHQKRVPFRFSSQFTGPSLSLKCSLSYSWSVNFHLGHIHRRLALYITYPSIPHHPGIQLPEFHQQQGPLMMYSSFVRRRLSMVHPLRPVMHLRINHRHVSVVVGWQKDFNRLFNCCLLRW